MKHIFLLLAALFPTILFGKAEVTYTRLQSLYSNAGIVVIDKVVLSDTATVMYCTAKGKINSWFQFAPSTYLSDEEDVRYPVKGAVGMTLGEKSYIPKSGQLEFRLLFEPMPKDTKIFDLIEGAEKDMFRIYGIHDAKSKVKIPDVNDEIDKEEISDKMFRKGKATVRGTIEGYSQKWSKDLLFFDISFLGYADIVPYPLNSHCTALNTDGTFCTELSLEHPVWAEMKIGSTNTSIPFYVRPGDTLDITVKKSAAGGEMMLDYTSSNPKGSCGKLMKHHNLPLICYDWNTLTDYGRNLDNKYFIEKVNASVDENMRLCNYVAWKYNLSPWETHLLKTRHKFELTERYLFMASKLFKEKVEYPRKAEAQKEDFTGYDYSPYKVLNILSLDDPSLSFLPYSLGFPPSLDLTYMMSFIGSYAFFDNVSKTEPFDYVKVELEKDRLQVEALRELTATKGTPWAIQAFLTKSITRLQDDWNKEQRNILVDFLSSSYLTYPYLKDKIKELNLLYDVASSPVYEIPEDVMTKDIKSVLDMYKGRYVHMVWLSDPKKDISFYGNPSVRNIIADEIMMSDLQVVFIVNGDVYSDKNELSVLKEELSASGVHIVDGETYLNMQAVFHFCGSGKQITFDRNGFMLKHSLDMKNETMYRDRFHNILSMKM